MQNRENIEFKTLDGTTLRGWIFPAAEKGPAVIMTPGFNIVKETVVADVAEYFHTKGFTILCYDPRCIGESDGLPRNESNPHKHIEDYHDALTFMKSHPKVDPARIAFWGYSFSATVALCAAALDKRAKAVVAVSPLTIWEFTKWRQVLAKAMEDRVSRQAGNEPVYLPMLTEDGENPAGFGAGMDVDVEDVYDRIQQAAEGLPTFRPETTLSTYYHIALFQPFALMSHVSPTPVMLVHGEKDQISPSNLQKTLIFDAFSEPKQLLSLPDKGHMNVMDSLTVLDEQIAFLNKHMSN